MSLKIKEAEFSVSTIKPAGHRILVRMDEVETKTTSGLIHLPESAKDRQEAAQTTGTLIAVGINAWSYDGEKPWAVPGDRVYFAKYIGALVLDPETGVKYHLMNDADIMGVYIPTGKKKGKGGGNG